MEAISIGFLLLTDLDGTVLDKNYSFRGAEDALSKLHYLGAQIVPVTSKTFSELLDYIKPLRLVSIHGTLILAPEDGSIIYYGRIGRNAFDGELEYKLSKTIIARPLRSIMDRIKTSIPPGCLEKIVLFSQAKPKTISKISGLDLEKAAKAGERHFVEIAYTGDIECKRAFYKKLLSEGLDVIWTWKYLHIGSGFGKEKAVAVIKTVLRKFGSPPLACLGDSESDAPFMEMCEYPIVIPRASSSIVLRRFYYKAPYGAPKGFAWAVEKILLPNHMDLVKPSIVPFLENPIFPSS